jgi:predicted permease
VIPDGMRRAFRLPTTSERIARELDDEVRFHVESRARSLIERGYDREAAFAEALRRFGDIDELRDYCVSMEVAHMKRMRFREWLETVAQDARFALRQFRKNPGFACVAALTLALGVGAATSIFSVVNGVVLRPLPFPASEKIVQIAGVDAKGKPLNTTADPTFDAIRTQNGSFAAIAEMGRGAMPIVFDGEVTRVAAATVSREFFDVFGVKPALGRFFIPEEQQLDAPLAVIISHGLWERHFGASRSVLNSTIHLGNASATVVGVMPAGQEYPAGTDLWMARETRSKNTSYTAHNWIVLARIKPAVTLAQANADLSRILRGVHARVGDDTWTVDGSATPLREQIVGNVGSLLLLLFAASGVLLLIACANVANLLIARMASREGEIAVRMAIGAGRSRLIQQLLIEAALLSFSGCVGGVALAYAGIKALLVLRPAVLPRVLELSVDWRVLVFALAVAAATAFALGLIAAWRGASRDLRAALAQSQRTQGGGSSYRVRGSLVVAQIAMTVVLLVGAGLLARSFVRLMSINAGFRTSGLVFAKVDFLFRKGEDVMTHRAPQLDELAARAATIPGVNAVAITDVEPFQGSASNGAFVKLSGADVKITQEELSPMFRDKSRLGFGTYRIVSGSYFRVMNIPLVSGRLIDEQDRVGTRHVAVVSNALAKKEWPGESPLGKVIEFGNIDGDMTPITIVGVVGDVLERDLSQPPTAAVYLSYRQRPGNGNSMTVVMSTPTENSVIASARQIFRQLRPDAPTRFQTIEEIIGRSVATQRFMLLLVGVFGAVALILATVGVYSVISYLVTQRGKEISIRVALGARGRDIVRLVVGQGLVLAAAGVIAGGVAAFATTRYLKTLLYDISTTDPLAFVAVITMLGAVAVAASYLPARRAARTEPMDVLRGG